MIDQTLQNLMRQVANTANFRCLFDHFSNDIELRMTMAVASSTRAERRGKSSVIRHLQGVGSSVPPRVGGPSEFFADGERCVVCHDEGIAIPAGLNLRCERTFVFDVREGLITRIGIHYELSPAVSRPAVAIPAEATAEA